MSSVKCNIAVSLDGFAAGPNQSVDNPIGEGGDRLHEWMFAADRPEADADAVDEILGGVGRTSWAARCLAAATGPGTRPGGDGGARILPTTRRSSSSLTTRASRC